MSLLKQELAARKRELGAVLATVRCAEGVHLPVNTLTLDAWHWWGTRHVQIDVHKSKVTSMTHAIAETEQGWKERAQVRLYITCDTDASSIAREHRVSHTLNAWVRSTCACLPCARVCVQAAQALARDKTTQVAALQQQVRQA